MKTPEELQKQYERALERARAEQIRITASQTKSDGTRIWLVANPAHDGYYTVRLEPGAVLLSCNCEAGRRNPGVPCKHRALVRFWLKEEHTAWERATAPRVQRAVSSELWYAA